MQKAVYCLLWHFFPIPNHVTETALLSFSMFNSCTLARHLAATESVEAQHGTDDSADSDDSIMTIAIPNLVLVKSVKVGIVEALNTTLAF